MADNFNTIAGWALAAGIIGWGMSSISAHYFKAERPETMGYKIAGVVEEGKGGAAEILALPASTLRSRMKKLGIR